MSIQHIFVTVGFSLLFILFIYLLLNGDYFKDRFIYFLLFGEDKIDYYFEILNLKFDKNSWLFKRLFISLLVSSFIVYAFFKDRIYIFPLILYVSYKYFYFDLYFRYRTKIKTINRELPYFLKMVVNGCYYRPLLGSLISASEFVFEEFKDDINYLITEIDDNPLSYRPYVELIEKYDNQIKHLDTYLKSLYRISQTSNLYSTELLETLSKMVSDDINIVRAEKNSVFNSSLSYFGLLPVSFLTIAICSALLLSIQNIL